MRKVAAADFISFLKQHNYDYYWENPVYKEYTLASIFNPVPEGFYFLTGHFPKAAITKSLILIQDETFKTIPVNPDNSYIVIQQDPQIVFYEFLKAAFSKKSSGIIQPSAFVHQEAAIGKNVQIDHFCVIGKCKIGDDAIISSHTVIENLSEIGHDTFIGPQSVIGADGIAWIWNADQTRKIQQPQLGGVQIGPRCFLGANTIIVKGSLNENTTVGTQTFFAPGCRIGHGTVIEENVHLANNVTTGGNSFIGKNSFIGSNVTLRPKVRLHKNTIVGAGAVVVKNTSKAGKTLMGVPAIEYDTKDHPSGMPKPVK